jgi:flagellar biosynthetic protein FliP
MFIMAPVFEEININALQPYLSEEMTSKEAFDIAKEPMRAFMLSQTRVKDLETFVQIGGYEGLYDDPADVPLTVLIPSFVTSELKTAFQIGFMLFIPFLILDLVVASILMAMGMMMLSPMIVSLPFKLMLFVLVDGWNLIFGESRGFCRNFARSYASCHYAGCCCYFTWFGRRFSRCCFPSCNFYQ